MLHAPHWKPQSVVLRDPCMRVVSIAVGSDAHTRVADKTLMLCRPSASLGSVIAVICVGLILLVYGEAEFNLAGFIIVMTASALSGLRWTITQVLLQGSSAHGVGDALLLLAMMTPKHSDWVLQSKIPTLPL